MSDSDVDQPPQGEAPASGSAAEAVAFKAKQAGEPAIGQEGVQDGEWALIDLNGVVVHVMQQRVRDYYQIEKLWELDPAAAEKLSQERG